jgi:hypothetical protein
MCSGRDVWLNMKMQKPGATKTDYDVKMALGVLKLMLSKMFSRKQICCAEYSVFKLDILFKK